MIKDQLDGHPNLKLKFTSEAGESVEVVLSRQVSHKRFMACAALYMLEKGVQVEMNPLAASYGLESTHGEAYTALVPGYEFLFGKRPALIAAIAARIKELRLKQGKSQSEIKYEFKWLDAQKFGSQTSVQWIQANTALVDAAKQMIPTFFKARLPLLILTP